MIPASFYNVIYYIIICISTIFIVNSYLSTKLKRSRYSHTYYIPIILIILFLIFFIGFRPVSNSFGDTRDYAKAYDLLWGGYFYFDWNATNLIFQNLLEWMSSKKIPLEYFFTLIAGIYFGGILVSQLKLFPRDTFLAVIVYLGAFSTFSYGTNGIKAGAAASIFLMALAYKDKLFIAIPLLIASLGFHHSMKVPIVGFIIAYFFKKPKWYFYLWITCLLLAAAHVTTFLNIFSELSSEGAVYLDDTSRENKIVSGFRIDFYLYSAIPIILGYIILVKKKIKDSTYSFIFCIYVFCNSIFLLCTYGTYINRIAYLSWSMYPILILYPQINISWNSQQTKYFTFIIFGHLVLTILMVI